MRLRSCMKRDAAADHCVRGGYPIGSRKDAINSSDMPIYFVDDDSTR
jgi:hypothetical protein